jgi:Flp pilus assembly secretin CpaC
MPGWARGKSGVVAVAALMTWSCALTPPVQHPDFEPEMTPAERDSENHGAGKSLQQALDQQMVSPEREARGGRRDHVLNAGDPIWVQSGKSRVISLPAAVKRVSIGNPDLAGLVVLGPRTIMINAKELPRVAGQTGGGRSGSGRANIVTNRTLTPEPRVAETSFTVWYGRNEEPDVHTIFVADFIDRQVLLEVTVAEINRTAIEDHGIDFRVAQDSFLASYFMGGGIGPSAIQNQTVPPQGGGTMQPILPLGTAPDRPTFGFVLPKDDVQALIKALQTDGFAKVLAQPKLLAMSGQNAVFQVGGEIPIRIATGFSTDIEFKPFGTIVNFVPRVSEEGDIMLTVTPEVSQADFSSLVEGIPSFRTRRASTSMRLRNGQTLVMGGLMQTTTRESVSGIPYLKDIPVVGYVFRQSSYTDEVTELVVVVTPHLVEPMAPGTTVALPTERAPLTFKEIRTRPVPAEASRPRLPGLP